jgi:hypothetical protein
VLAANPIVHKGGMTECMDVFKEKEIFCLECDASPAKGFEPGINFFFDEQLRSHF